MEEHKHILELLSKNEFPEEITEGKFALIGIFKELYKQGYVTAIDASSGGGDSYLEPRITISGRKFLSELANPVSSAQHSITIGNISGSTFQVGNGNSLSVHVSVKELVENVAKSNDLEAKSKLKELLNNATVAGLIGAGATALLALL
ncbi:hypothetical protein [Rheinheimera sp. NSM]|uniref:hypothetical protein n=1 Tax=Rheinheimera sp. NSM TaxID=3457884 RepID=UPI0040364DA4